MKVNQQHTSTTKEKGFTLVEILIALTIFAIGILGVASMQAWGLRGNASAIWHSQAATLAADKIEELMMVSYDTLESGPTTLQSETQGDYTINWTVTPNTPINLTTTITINVTWNDHGTAKTFTPDFTFYRASIGPD
jgi:type IV pilus assembly protein PilV